MNARLAAYMLAEEKLKGANSQVAAAASLFIAGKIELAELAHFSTKANAAESARNLMERVYRNAPLTCYEKEAA